jgi:cytochrome c553
MRHSRMLPIVFFVSSSIAFAADIEAGKAKVATVCAACHGAAGVSVAEHIPNLAGQRVPYLTAQLTAFKEGTRKNPIMNAIAPQLTADDVANVTAYFASLAPAGTSTKSALLPNLAKARIALPANPTDGMTRYFVQNVPDSRQVKVHYVNAKGWAAVSAGQALPDGTLILVEVYSARLDADKKPIIDATGHFIPDQLRGYTAMARDTGWGDDIPEMLRNENWNYAVFTADRAPRAGINQAECLACHKPKAAESYIFSMKELSSAARK